MRNSVLSMLIMLSGVSITTTCNGALDKAKQEKKRKNESADEKQSGKRRKLFTHTAMQSLVKAILENNTALAKEYVTSNNEIKKQLYTLLKEYKTDTGLTLLDVAISRNNIALVKTLLPEVSTNRQYCLIANLNNKNKHLLLKKPEYSIIALHVAASSNDLALAKNVLSTNHALVHQKDSNNSTALHIAAAKGNVDIITYLLENNANSNATNARLATPLHVATQKGHLAAVKCLLDHNAHTEATNNLGFTPLHQAVFSGRFEILRYLTYHGAKIDTLDAIAQSTPLHSASFVNHLEMVQFLTEKDKMLLNAEDLNGKTALSLAIQEEHREIIEYLIGAGALVKNTDMEATEDTDLRKLLAATLYWENAGRETPYLEYYLKEIGNNPALFIPLLLRENTSKLLVEKLCDKTINSKEQGISALFILISTFLKQADARQYGISQVDACMANLKTLLQKNHTHLWHALRYSEKAPRLAKRLVQKETSERLFSCLLKAKHIETTHDVAFTFN